MPRLGLDIRFFCCPHPSPQLLPHQVWTQGEDTSHSRPHLHGPREIAGIPNPVLRHNPQSPFRVSYPERLGPERRKQPHTWGFPSFQSQEWSELGKQRGSRQPGPLPPPPESLGEAVWEQLPAWLASWGGLILMSSTELEPANTSPFFNLPWRKCCQGLRGRPKNWR